MRILFAAEKSGSGKTLLTCAFLQYLKNSGLHPRAFKTGPDYIDPLFHRSVLGVASGNLDTFFTPDAVTRALLASQTKPHETVVIEGVMGLYGGRTDLRGKGSTYDLARATKTPVILIIDAKGMGHSLIALIQGFLHYDAARLIQGVILNRTSVAFAEKIRPMLEKETGIRLIGAFADDAAFHLKHRPLGLVPPTEAHGVRAMIAQAAERFANCLDTQALLEIAASAPELPPGSAFSAPAMAAAQKCVIAVARDEAFCFLYEENLALLQAHGAELAFFSPLRGACLPQKCSGLLLPGGYPERYAKRLSENSAMRQAVKHAIQGGMPCLAEGGGFLYLHEGVAAEDGNTYALAGIKKGICRNTGHLVRFGYKEAAGKRGQFLAAGETLRGHEFHYYDAGDAGAPDAAMSWAHWYYPSCPDFARRFVEAASRYGARWNSSPRPRSAQALAGGEGQG